MITQSVYLVKCLELSIYKALGLFAVSKLSLKYQDKERASKNWQIFLGTFKVPTTKIANFWTLWTSCKLNEISMSQSHRETGETHSEFNSFSASLDPDSHRHRAGEMPLTLYCGRNVGKICTGKKVKVWSVAMSEQSPLLRPPLRGGSLLTSSL